LRAEAQSRKEVAKEKIKGRRSLGEVRS